MAAATKHDPRTLAALLRVINPQSAPIKALTVHSDGAFSIELYEIGVQQVLQKDQPAPSQEEGPIEAWDLDTRGMGGVYTPPPEPEDDEQSGDA